MKDAKKVAEQFKEILEKFRTVYIELQEQINAGFAARDARIAELEERITTLARDARIAELEERITALEGRE